MNHKSYFLLLSILLIFSCCKVKEETIIKVDDQKVSKSEFLQIYLKNNNAPKYDKESLDEYIDLFTKFKLKVVEAEKLGYDTIPKLVRELNGYKKQLSLPYLIDSAKNESLVKEAYSRMTKEIRASHILIKMKQNPTPKDTLMAYNKLVNIKKRLENGEDFASIAKSKNGSDDPSAANNGGDLGFFSAFQMIYPFEEKAYNTKVGEISEPFRTRFGYHILKVTDQREARGTMKAAHLMVATSKNAKEEFVSAKKKIDELHSKLVNGEATWEELVELHSDDPSTNKKGGLLPIFGSGSKTRMLPIFEETAFSLNNDGDISAPIKTDYGYHIIKRVEKSDVKSYNELKKEIQAKVNKDIRSKKTQSTFVEKLKIKYGAKEYRSNLTWFYNNVDSTYFSGKWNPKTLSSSKVLFTLPNSKYTQTDFYTYIVRNWRGLPKVDIKSLVDKQFKKWQKSVVLDYEESQLPTKYPKYKALVKEYHDGVLLYEIMSDMVWNKAVKDTLGLQSFFNNNQNKYVWPKRIDATVYECLNQSIAEQVFIMLDVDTNTSKEIIEKVNATSELNLSVKMNKFDPITTDFLKNDLSQGRNIPYVIDKKYYVVVVHEFLPPMNKDLNETKGLVISDYQEYLEKKWINELKTKHEVEVNYKALYSLGDKK